MPPGPMSGPGGGPGGGMPPMPPSAGWMQYLQSLLSAVPQSAISGQMPPSGVPSAAMLNPQALGASGGSPQGGGPGMAGLGNPGTPGGVSPDINGGQIPGMQFPPGFPGGPPGMGGLGAGTPNSQPGSLHIPNGMGGPGMGGGGGIGPMGLLHFLMGDEFQEQNAQGGGMPGGWGGGPQGPGQGPGGGNPLIAQFMQDPQAAQATIREFLSFIGSQGGGQGQGGPPMPQNPMGMGGFNPGGPMIPQSPLPPGQ